MEFSKKMRNTAFLYALAAMAGGIFYREYTKFNGFTGKTNLSVIHTHLFLLGMVFFLVVTLFSMQVPLQEQKRFSLFYIIYQIGLFITTVAFIVRGLYQVHGTELSKAMDASISGVAGIGHICIGIGMILFFGILKKAMEEHQ